MDGGLAKVSGQAICRLELMTQRLRERKPLYRPWWLTTEPAPPPQWEGLRKQLTCPKCRVTARRVGKNIAFFFFFYQVTQTNVIKVIKWVSKYQHVPISQLYPLCLFVSEPGSAEEQIKITSMELSSCSQYEHTWWLEIPSSFINTLPHRCLSARNIMTRLTCVTFGLTGGYCDLRVINYIDKLLTMTLIFWQCLYLTQEGSTVTHLTTLNPVDSAVILLCFRPRRPEVRTHNGFISGKQQSESCLYVKAALLHHLLVVTIVYSFPGDKKWVNSEGTWLE